MKRKKVYYGPNIDNRFTFVVGHGSKAFKRQGFIDNKKDFYGSLRDLIQTFLGIPEEEDLKELRIPIGFENGTRRNRRR